MKLQAKFKAFDIDCIDFFTEDITEEQLKRKLNNICNTHTLLETKKVNNWLDIKYERNNNGTVVSAMFYIVSNEREAQAGTDRKTAISFLNELNNIAPSFS